MNMRMLVGTGFLLHALLGPWCMAIALNIDEPGTRSHAIEHHHASADTESAQDDAASNCAKHCLEQAKDIMPSHAPALPVAHIIDAIDSWDLVFTAIKPQSESPVSSPPFYIAAEKTVLLL